MDRLFKARSPGSMRPPLFILGVPRSGTTLTYQVVIECFEVSYLTTSQSYLHGLANIQARLLSPFIRRPKARFESRYGKIKGLLSPSENARFWRPWFPAQRELGHYVDPENIQLDAYAPLIETLNSLSAITRRPYIIKCLYLTLAAGVLAQVFTNARFLVVRREPLLVIQSILGVRQSRPRAEEWWSVKPPGYEDWMDLPLWKQVARQVYHTERLVFEQLARYAGERWRVLQYERLCSSPKSVVRELADWLCPIGYMERQQCRVPDGFEVSRALMLSARLVDDIQLELNELKAQYGFEL